MNKNKINLLSIALLVVFVSSVFLFTGCTQSEDSDDQDLNSQQLTVPINEEVNNQEPSQRPGNNEIAGERMTPPLNEEGENQRQPREEKSGVSPKAIDACVDLNEGDTCSFSTPREDMNGICSTVENIFACGPEFI